MFGRTARGWVIARAKRRSGRTPDEARHRQCATFTLGQGHGPATLFISRPDAYTVVIAALCGVVGMLSLTTASAGSLIGVLISVTTIPPAGNVGVAAAYGNSDEMWAR
ncbi:MAG: DUF389 domain-containing protein [Kofleriaceae bacterium]|nr:DUF389 domain-containing protein [Kofleriaceae bacterium]